jgi:asparagine N-glycosylation enzyme membrane subunit Stt3
MVRLMLTLTPCVCVLSAIAFSTLFERYEKEDDVGGGSNETNVSNGNGDNKNGRPYD